MGEIPFTALYIPKEITSHFTPVIHTTENIAQTPLTYDETRAGVD